MALDVEKEPIRLRIVSKPGIDTLHGYSVRVQDVASGRDLDGVYKVEFSADADGTATVVVHAYCAEIDVVGIGFVIPNKEMGVALTGANPPELVRLPRADTA